MLNNYKKRSVIFGLSLLILFGLIGFVENNMSHKMVRNIIINIKDQHGSHFVDDGDIMKTISLNSFDSVRGMEYREINLKSIETKIRSNKFVDWAEVYKDHKGNILIDVKQRHPLARIIHGDNPHAYLYPDGSISPMSDKYTARVVIIDGENAGKLFDSTYRASDESKALMKMLRTIENDKFLKAQVSQITFKKNGELELRTQVGNELFLFGKPEAIETKFHKLKVYYKKIVRMKGFNKYKVVNLKYKEQIICE